MEKIITPFKKGLSSLIILCLAYSSSFAREAVNPHSLGTVKEFKGSFSRINPAAKQLYTLQLTATRQATLSIAEKISTKNEFFIFASVVGHEQATCFIRGNGNGLSGKVIFRKTKEAFDIYSNELGVVFISPVDIDNVICVDYQEYKNEDGEENEVNPKNNEMTVLAPLLNSLPGAVATLYLDFDGENVPSTSNWGAINAAPSGFSDPTITTIWTAVSEDYSPFNVNVTTDRAVFNSAPTNKRMMVIFTPTNTAAPGAGGVAYLNSWGSGEPCWVFNNFAKGAFEAASHEAGHTMGLSHDGTSSPVQEYFAGHGSWGPIMGAVYSRSIVQWSKGEYTSASNTQNDLTIISNKLAYRVDDAGNTPAASKALVIGSGGSVASSANYGVIERTTDVDVFGFNTTGGTVTFSLIAKTQSGSSSIPNLDIQARLLNSAGTELAKVNPTTALTSAVSLSQSLSAGTYYLEIDGIGAGNPLNTGYSDYGSIGQYFISGTIPGGTSTGSGMFDDLSVHPINVFPNPSSGIFSINIPFEGDNESTLEIINSLGQPVVVSAENTTGALQKEIDLTGYASGIYCIVVTSGTNVWKGKVILK